MQRAVLLGHVSSVGAALYDNAGVAHLGNRRFDRPVVADPELTQMNQAAPRYTRQGATVHVGRQEILLDDQRFVGNVGWRQNHQSFDAVRAESSDVPGTTVNYAFIRGIHGIRGGAIPVSSQLLNAAFAVHAAARVVGHAYGIGNEDDPRRSTHWHGMFEVAEGFCMELIPQAQEIVDHAAEAGRRQAAATAGGVLDGILSRSEHAWFTEGAESESARIRAEMTRRYGEAGR